MDAISFKFAVVVVSELVTTWLVWRLWRSGQHLFFKVSLSVLGVIPILGPLLIIWIADFPPRVHPMLRDHHRYSADVHDRWREVHAEKDPQRRLQKWISALKNYKGDDT